MGGPPPVNDYESLVALAGRIHKFLGSHPRDRQALNDLHYVTGLMQGPAGATQATNAAERAATIGPETPNPGAAVMGGLTQAALDVPRSLLQAVLHPIKTAGQVTGLGNIGAAVQTFRDPEASGAERLDAVARATPLNLGYSTERNLLNATGAKSEVPQSLEDQVHAAGNVASLGLLGVKPKAGLRLIRGGVAKALRATIGQAALDRAAGVAAKVAAPVAETPGGPTPAELALAEKFGVPVESMRGRATAVPMPRTAPAYSAPSRGILQPSATYPGGLEVTGPAPPLKAPSTMPTLGDMTGVNQMGDLADRIQAQRAADLAPRGLLRPASELPLAQQQLQLLLSASPEDFAAAKSLMPLDIWKQIGLLRLQM